MSYTRPNTRVHRDVWATLDADKRTEVKALADRIAADDPDLEPNQVWDQALQDIPRADSAETTAKAAKRIGRLHDAEEEAKVHKQWVANGREGDEPPTPNLDALRNGEKIKADKASPAAQAEAPEVQDGSVAVALRGKTQPVLLRGLLGDNAVDTFERLVITTAEAQAVVDKLRAAEDATNSQYTGRCLESAITLVRHAVPTTTDPNGGAIAKAVDALIAAGIVWAPVIKNDGSTHFTVGEADEVLNARKVLTTYKTAVEEAPAE